MSFVTKFRKKKSALLVSAVLAGSTVMLTACNDDTTTENPFDDSALQSQIEQLEEDLQMQEDLLELALKQQPVGFIEVPYPTTDAEKRDVLASPYAIIETNSFDIAEIGFNTILRSGEYASDTDAFPYGQIVDENGVAVMATDGSMDISNSNDFASLLPVGDSLYMVSHFEDRPAAMYLAELNQDPTTGELTALRSKPLDFSAWKGGWVHCAGSVTPWNTHLGSEEYEPDASAWDPTTGEVDDYYNAIAPYFGGDLTQTHPYYYGYQVEVAVADYDNATVTKHYSMGRVAHELGYVMPDEKTVYISDDGTNVGLFMFIADTAGDLSSGTLYVAKWNQTSGTGVGSADLTWVNLGPATNAQIASALAADVRYEDLLDEVAPLDGTDTNADGVADTWGCPTPTSGDPYIEVNHTYGHECLRLQPGSIAGVSKDILASRLETRRYAAMMGGTTEFRKMEGITHNPDDSKLYVAMSEVARGMEDFARGGSYRDSYDKGGYNDITVEYNSCGAVYESNLNGTTPVNDTDGAAIDSQYIATDMSGLVVGVPTTYDASSPYAGNSCDVNGIASPDNITFLPGRDTLIIGEDTSAHQNDLIWSYNLTRDELTRIQTTPYGSETTSPYFYPNINGFAYLMSVIQHPFGESDQDQLNDVLESRAYTGYIGPFPAMD